MKAIRQQAELLTVKQAAGLVAFYSRYKCVISREAAERDASDACRTIIALHEALAAETARADAAEARVAVRVKPLETAESRELQQSAGIPHLPTQLTYECRLAISGEGPRACDWTDKPHRLVYDLCREIERIAALETGDGDE